MPATYRILIDWDGDGTFDHAGSDVTARVLGTRTPFTSRYGRDQARALAPPAPNPAHLELNNASRDYSPENSGSPLAGLVRPGRGIVALADINTDTYPIYSGHLDDYTVQPAMDKRSVDVSCLDGLGRHRGVPVTTALYAGLRTGQAIHLVLDAVGWPEDLRDIDFGSTVMPWWWLQADDAYDAIQQLVDSEGPPAFCVTDLGGMITFRDRHHRVQREHALLVQATWGGPDPGDPSMSEPFLYHDGWRDIINVVDLDVPVRQPSGTLAVVWSSDGQRALSDGETISVSATSSTPFLSAVAPEIGTDVVVVSGAVTAQLLHTSGASTTVLITATGGPAVVSRVQVRGYPLVTQTTVQVRAEDTASIDEYGRRALPSGRRPVWAGVHDAAAIAAIILSQRAQRLPTVTVTMQGKSDDQLLHQLSRILSDRVRIIEPELGLDADFYVELIAHDLRGGPLLATKFGAEMVPATVADPFTFDVSGRGFDDGRFGDTGRDDPESVFVFDHPVQGQFDVGLFGT